MTITPLRNMLALTPLPSPDEHASGLVLMRADHPTRRYTVVAVGPEVRDIAAGQVVLVSAAHGLDVGPWVLVAESSVLGVCA